MISHDEEYLNRNFEIDYWGTSYRQALEFIDANDSTSPIKIYYENPPCEINLHGMPFKVKQKLSLTKDKNRHWRKVATLKP